MKILILGSTGMLGSMVLKYLSEKDLDITTPTRKEVTGMSVGEYDYIINCIGIIKQKLDDPVEAIRMNSLFPYDLAKGAPQAKIIQIATDCVFSGKDGHYFESDKHDGPDIYDQTKSLGEVQAKNFYNIRTSIVGPASDNKSLLEWFLSQEENATVKGYTDHLWNGITTFHFAQLCYAIIKGKRKIPNNLHFTPYGKVTKYELLKIFAERFNRKDIKIKRFQAGRCNRVLLSKHIEVVSGLWEDMGYKTPPTIKDMIYEL